MPESRPTAKSVDAQVRQLQAEGCEKVFREVASGAKTDRRQLRRAIEQLAAGDVLIVTRLDRLARSTRDLINTLAEVTDRKAGFRSLDDTGADSTTPRSPDAHRASRPRRVRARADPRAHERRPGPR
jgi:DNA invertase Pin-like site-specific DNA recombinase